MRTDVPLSQMFDCFELESKGLRDLFKIEMNDANSSTLYLTPHNAVTYMDHTWEYLPCKVSDNAYNSTGEQSRPKFSAVNPEGIFSIWIGQGAMDGALITRYRVLLTDLEADVRAYTRNVWMLSKILSLNNNLVAAELRSTMDGANFQIPARQFYPPNFRHVSLR